MERFGSGSNVSEQRSGCGHPTERFAKQGAACEVSTLAHSSAAGSGPWGPQGNDDGLPELQLVVPRVD
ncbi:hypothetical protein CTA1_5505 [Colletotrichum tanaceti]|uniref:Uncharacterized protein n=1 Tax=Colletotrichum tanaceti TaxID=1306861 RepID=A0A4U6XEI2_9PEZI|nr:hypothetical protein CTA1_5505 [Colletotrichum tanaceti]